ncbi:hypothetical protein PVMG_05112 [Plasmodium vivax Mauritania I]|uniref:Uncharacterized protein n=1 Tax=Plasmodium vivax Mauritania I TaxID=1035515 RepID=A0A0J9TJ03_PLAVI|nr:hypothetical protein PVMG_05112 [Plasmodium vivax Mauritania I]
MTECTSGSDTYLDYKCYQLLEPKFGKIYVSDYGRENLDNAKKEIKKTYQQNNLERFEKFFEIITSCLQHDGVFINADPRIPCSYINYLLNKKLREQDMHSSNTNYGILKDFVMEYHKSKGSGRYAHICTSEIKSLEYEEYHKMTFLYQLYNDYITIVKNNKPNDDNKCNILSTIILNYNNAIDSYQKTDDKLINKLIDLKQLIARKILPNNQGCQKEITYFNLSKKEIEEQQRLAEEQKQLEKEKLLAEQLLQEKRLSEARLDQEKRLSEEEHLDSEGQQRRFQTRPVRHESHEQEQLYRVPPTQDPYLPHIQESKLEGSYKVSQSFGEPENSRIKMEQLQDQGVLGQMQNAFSSIVQNVDPAPVLGVSGGMGVLFILFKVFKVLKL